MAGEKKFQGYGLILKKTSTSVGKEGNGGVARKKPSVFDDDEGDDNGDDSSHSAVNVRLQLEARRKKLQKQTVLEMQKALSEDPTVYEYDNVYDEIEKKRTDTILQKSKDRQPKYIKHLKKAADERKLENERRTEKKVQKEREDEGSEFADKEAFVTSSYKNKLREIQEAEEKLKLEAAREAAMDVTKQNDLTGFYRYILNQTVGEVKSETQETTEKIEQKKEESVTDKDGQTLRRKGRTEVKRKNDSDNSNDGQGDGERKTSRNRSSSEDEPSGRKNRDILRHSNRRKEGDSSRHKNETDRRGSTRKRQHSSDNGENSVQIRKYSKDRINSRKDSTHRSSTKDERSSVSSSQNNVSENIKRRHSSSENSNSRQTHTGTDSNLDRKESKQTKDTSSTKNISDDRELTNSEERTILGQKNTDIQSGSEDEEDSGRNSQEKKATKSDKKAEPKNTDVYKKRNTEEDISAARKRYLLRRKTTKCVIAQDSGEDN